MYVVSELSQLRVSPVEQERPVVFHHSVKVSRITQTHKVSVGVQTPPTSDHQ
jgi:hypothetical protein